MHNLAITGTGQLQAPVAERTDYDAPACKRRMRSPLFGRSMLMDHLAQAERHIAQGQVIIERQISLVAELARDGHDTEEARALLAIRC